MERILIVDDEAFIRENLERILEEDGYHPLSTDNGDDAIREVGESDVDLVLLDLMMPVMNGFEFLHTLRKHEAWQRVPVVVLTAMELDERELADLDRHVETVIRKAETSPQSILEHIRHAIGSA